MNLIYDDYVNTVDPYSLEIRLISARGKKQSAQMRKNQTLQKKRKEYKS